MVDYRKGKIYKITSYQTDEVYYGSCCNTLKKRFSNHKSKSNGCASKRITQYEDCIITLVENFPCNNKDELKTRERYYIENFDCLNKNIPGQTKAEYRIKNLEKKKEYNKEYNIVNKEKISIQKKEHYNNNKAAKLEYMKEYNDKNKDKIKAKRSKKVECECGGVYSLSNKAVHYKTKKHQSYISSLN